MESDRGINLLVQLLSSLDIVRGELASYAVILQVGVNPPCEFFVFCGIADETRIELNAASKCIYQANQLIAYTGAA